ncbi:MAG TPA: DUF4331 family protein [Labilithrix sp.]|jgi:hypothetical protein
MNARKNLLAFAAIALVGAWGCTQSDAGDDSQGSEADLGLHSGSVDHAAIVEVTTMMLASGPTDGNLDPYNEEDPYAIHGTQYKQAFTHRLAAFDALDGHTDWTPDQIAAWTGRVSTGNYLVVDTSKPCDWENPHTYLEIERAQLTGKAHATCGGRMPNEDALDVTINFLARGPAASRDDQNALHDGVEQATKKADDSFPYLAEMNGL